MRSIKSKMLVYLLVPLIATSLLMTMVSYYMARQALTEEISTGITSLSHDYQGRLTTWLGEREGLLGGMTTALGYIMDREGGGNEAGIRSLLTAEKTQSGVMAAYIGLEDGRFMDDAGWVPPAGYDPRARAWYMKAKQANAVAYSEVYEDAITKKMVVSIAKPVHVQGKLVGVAGVDIDLDEIKKITGAAKLGQTGYVFVVDSKSNYLAHPILKPTESMLTVQNGAFKQIAEMFLSGKDIFHTFVFNGVERYYASAVLPKAGWVVIAAVPTEELFAGVTRLGMVLLVIGLLMIGILSAIIWRVAASVSRPVQEAAAMAAAIAQGNLTDSAVSSYQSNDEIGILIRDMNTMQQNLRAVVVQTADTANQLAAASEQLSASSDQSAQASEHIAQSIQEVAADSEKQVNSITQTSAAVEQMSAAVEEVAATAVSVASAADETAKAADEGNQAAGAAVARMTNVEAAVADSARLVSRLGERSKEIGQIVDTISGIAGQTNLLALNAAIEAARAGEQGRGFAVVADEVRRLAEQSQDAAKEIGKLIAEVQAETDLAVAAMNKGAAEVRDGVGTVSAAGQAFEHITVLIAQASDQLREISAAIQEMAGESQRVVYSVKEIDTVCKTTARHAESVSAATEEQTASMEEISKSSHSLAGLAHDLQQLVARFKVR